MKIAISGSQNTGKTTLLNLLKQEGGVVFLTEIVRQLVTEGILINKNADHRSQCLILEQHYRNCLKYDSFVTDRGAIDAFVYATQNFLDRKFSFQEHKEHETLFLSSLPYYDYHFYLPPLGFIEDDGVRSNDQAYQKDIDRIFKTVYKRYNIPFFELKGNPSEKKESFVRILNQKGVFL